MQTFGITRNNSGGERKKKLGALAPMNVDINSGPSTHSVNYKDKGAHKNRGLQTQDMTYTLKHTRPRIGKYTGLHTHVHTPTQESMGKERQRQRQTGMQTKRDRQTEREGEDFCHKCHHTIHLDTKYGEN